METRKINISCNGHFVGNLGIYNIESINELEDGTIFGLITNKAYMDVIFPSSVTRDGYFNNYIINVDEDVAATIGFTSKTYASNNDIPLIFKKLGNNYAQELISGLTFFIANETEEIIGSDEEGKTIEEFQRDLKKYSNDNVVLLNLVKTFEEGTIPAIFVVNDRFKVFYYDEALLSKEEIKKALISLKAAAKNYYNIQMEDIIENAIAVAYTDNFLYDIEHSTKKLTRN
jgi:hypothetical protein